MQVNYLTGVQVSSGTYKTVTHSEGHVFIIIAPFYRFYFPTHSPKPSLLLETGLASTLHYNKNKQKYTNAVKFTKSFRSVFWK